MQKIILIEFYFVAKKNENFLQKFGYTASSIPQETFSFFVGNVCENAWKHMDVLPVYITTMSQGLPSGIHEDVFKEKLKLVDKKIEELNRKQADMQRKLDYSNRKIQEIENKFNQPPALLSKVKKAAYEKELELTSQMLSTQGIPDLAQLFTEIKEMNEKSDSLKQDIVTIKAKLRKYGQLPPNINGAKAVVDETILRYKNDSTKMKNFIQNQDGKF